MRKSITGKLALLLALLMSLTLAFAACGQSEEPAPAEDTAEAEETAEVPTVSGTVTTNIDMTGYDAGKVVRVWVPVGQQNEDQVVEEAVIDAGDAKAEITTDANGNKMAYIEWGADADPADVLKAVLTNEWDKADAEALECKEYYWGAVDEKRVELSRGRDVTLSPAQDAGELNDFGYPYAEVDGEIVDFYQPADFVYTISFTAD